MKCKHVMQKDRIHLSNELGAGAYGKVHLAKVSGWATPMVVKMLKPKDMQAKDLDLLKLEMIIWSKIDHPHCLPMIGLALEPTEFCLVSEWCRGGSLGDAVALFRAKQKPTPTPAAIASMMSMIASGMAHLHKHGVMHRDLKSPNILLERKGDTLLESCPLKIADFGLARNLPAADRASCLTAETGSYRWMAPEVIRHEPYNSRADVYSFAVVCFELMTYELPFTNSTAVEAALAVATKDRRPELPAGCDSTIAKLVRECWDASGEMRPSFQEIIERLDARARALSGEGSSSARPSPRLNERRGSGDGKAQKREPENEPLESTHAMKRPNSISSGLLDLAMDRATSPPVRKRASPRSSPGSSPRPSPVMPPFVANEEATRVLVPLSEAVR